MNDFRLTYWVQIWYLFLKCDRILWKSHAEARLKVTNFQPINQNNFLERVKMSVKKHLLKEKKQWNNCLILSKIWKLVQCFCFNFLNEQTDAQFETIVQTNEWLMVNVSFRVADLISILIECDCFLHEISKVNYKSFILVRYEVFSFEDYAQNLFEIKKKQTNITLI